jgi:hypothetical protein
MSTTYTPPDFTAWLTSIDAAIAAKVAGADIVSYSIGGRQFTKRTLQELLDDRERLLALYNAEQAGGNVTLANMNGSLF